MKKSMKRNAPLFATIGGVALFSSACTLDEVLTIARIVALFV